MTSVGYIHLKGHPLCSILNHNYMYSILMHFFRSLSKFIRAPTKFVPWSHLNCLTGPRRFKNRLRALIKDDVFRELTVSKCALLFAWQVNRTPYRFTGLLFSLIANRQRNLLHNNRTVVKVLDGLSVNLTSFGFEESHKTVYMTHTSL